MLVYPLRPNKITALAISYDTRQVSFEQSAYIQKISTRSDPKLIFTLEHTLNSTDELALTDFFNKCRGAFATFRFYNHVDAKTYSCSFKEDNLVFNRVNVNLSRVSVRIETC